MEQERVPQWTALGVVALTFMHFALVFEALPERVASHFNLAGHPDGFQTKLGFVLSAGLLQLMFGLLVWVSPSLIRSTRDELLNLPHKRYWLAPERRAQTKQRLALWTTWLACGTVALLSGIFNLVARANLSDRHLGPQLWLLLGAYVVFALGAGIALVRAFRLPASA